MNPETFFDNFGLLADTPNGVQKLRVLILQLAFKGKLINNRQKQNMTDHGGDLPTGWQQRTVGDLSKAIMPGFACNKSFQMTDGHVHLRTHNIDTNGKLNFDLLVKIDHKKVDMKKAQIHKGDIIFNNTNSQELVGKTCIVDQDYFYGFSNHLTLIKVIDEVEPTYIVYYFNLLLHIGYFAKLCNRWIGQAGINTKMLKPVLIPLPPLEEQKRIVAKVDQLMALCDKLEARQQKKQEACLHLNIAALDRLLTAHEPDEFAHHWQRICDNFDLLYGAPETVGELRKAILQLAVQGMLVPQDANDEPAAVLLERIKAEKERLVKGGMIKKSKPLPSITVNEIYFELPDGWQWVRFDDICSYTQRGKGPKYVEKSDIPVVSQKCIQWDGFKLGRARFISPSSLEKYNDERFLRTGDLLWNSTGTGTIGRVNVYVHEDNSYDKVVADSHVTVVRPILLNSRFIYCWIASPMIQNEIEEMASGTTNQIELNLSTIKNNLVPLAPLQEQKRIVAKVDQLMALCDELEAKLKQSQTDGEKLMAAVGELVDA